LRLKILKISMLSILSVLAVLMIAGAALYWKLNNGPISMTFLNGKIETAINSQLTNMKVSLGDAVLEVDQSTNIPHVRFRNLVLRDMTGTIIASAPKAAVTLDSSSLLSGKIVTRSLELIGPKISVRRNLDGSVVLGVGGLAADNDQTIVLDNDSGKSGLSVEGEPPPAANQSSGGKLIQLLAERDGSAALATIQDIKISQASLNVFDDANAANWFAPLADLTFRKTASGFDVLAKADVNSAAEPWHAEISASYARDSHRFNVSTTVDNLILANVADKIFALSQFAKVKFPLSGHIDFEASEAGLIETANADLSVGAGEMNLPDYLAQPIVVDEGNLRVNYEATTGKFNIGNSSVLVSGQRADISGNILPVRSAGGKLTAVNIELKAKNVKINAAENLKHSLLVDRIEFVGKAAIEQARLDIDDLVVMSGNSGVRLRGIITGGSESPGIQFAGRVRDLSADMLKKLWPPIIASRSRNWVTENVVSGRVSEGTFQINLPVNALARAKKNQRIPDNTVDFTFKLDAVSTHYFKGLPLLVNATGEAHQKDNNFDIKIFSGQSELPSGKTVKLNQANFSARGVMLDEVAGAVNADIQGPIDAMLELASEPDLNLVKVDMSKLPKLKGTAQAEIGLQFPLIKNVPKSRVEFTNKVTVENAEVINVLPNVDLTDGSLAVDVSGDKITVSGPAKVNGLAAKVVWEKPKAGGAATTQIAMTVDQALREKMGVKLNDYMSGNIPVQASISQGESGSTVVDVKADLSSVKMKLAAVGWKREAVDGTTASFKVMADKNGNKQVEDFKLDGAGLRLRGNINIAKGGKLQSVDMSEIRLDEDNVFSAKVIPGDGTTDLTISGKNFDARPYIKNLIAPLQKTGASQQTQGGQDFTMKAHFDHVTANRGEAVNDVTAVLRARAGKIAAADITGTFLSGQPITIRVNPLPQGRAMRVDTTDGGAAIRAANFYSKMAGGELRFSALVGNEQGSPVRNGQLFVQNFEVRNEAALAQLDQRGKPKKSGPRNGGIGFKKLFMPFTIDDKFVRLGDVILRGQDMCATASGVIRKADGALEVTGTVVPVCAVTGAFNNVPLIGQILTGGNDNEGIFGMTYSMGGTLTKPNVRVNPISVLAPGIFRRFFDFHNGNVGTKN
jgi:Protein of unknown function/AsmA-like C-terminal region